jgi:hypothetical protein
MKSIENTFEADAPFGRRASRRALVTGRILSGLVIAFLTFDAVAKLAEVREVLEGTARLGYPPSVAFGLGVVLLACVVVYAIPRTSVLGAILLTGYLGGAIATHVRVGAPLFTHTLFPIYVAVLLWGGMYLRDGRLRAMIPLRARD